jgi:hypothetical protein
LERIEKLIDFIGDVAEQEVSQLVTEAEHLIMNRDLRRLEISSAAIRVYTEAVEQMAVPTTLGDDEEDSVVSFLSARTSAEMIRLLQTHDPTRSFSEPGLGIPTYVSAEKGPILLRDYDVARPDVVDFSTWDKIGGRVVLLESAREMRNVSDVASAIERTKTIILVDGATTDILNLFTLPKEPQTLGVHALKGVFKGKKSDHFQTTGVLAVKGRWALINHDGHPDNLTGMYVNSLKTRVDAESFVIIE